MHSLLQHITSLDELERGKMPDVLNNYWRLFGIRSRERLCEEEPDLCEMMAKIEERALSCLT
ncbi:hypothetical protein EU522_00820 [Candidatus Thorarchaeota archaeon]|nr:MAG: hypothetical protein EU522_00820 [Candidatus Thorarchaeota archaeon]